MSQSDGASAPQNTDTAAGAARRSAGGAAAVDEPAQNGAEHALRGGRGAAAPRPPRAPEGGCVSGRGEGDAGAEGIDAARAAQPAAAPDVAARGGSRKKRAPSFEPADVPLPTAESTKATSSSHANPNPYPNNDAAPRRTAATAPQGYTTIVGLLFVLIACAISALVGPKADATRSTLRWRFNSATKKSPFYKVLSKCCMAPGDGKVRAFHFISDSHGNNLKAAEEYAKSMHKGATLITDVPNSMQAMDDKRIVRGGCNVVFVRVTDKVDLTLAHHLKGMRDGQDEETLSLGCTAFVFSSEGSDRVPHYRFGVLGAALAQEALGHFGPHTRLYNIFYTVRLPDFHHV